MTYILLFLYLIIGNHNYEVFRIDLGIKSSTELNTINDPRSVMKYAVTEKYFFIADFETRSLIRADISNKRKTSINFLTDVYLLDLLVVDSSLLIHRHGSSIFECYDIHTSNKKQDVAFPADIKYGAIEIFTQGFCFFYSSFWAGQTYVSKLAFVDNKYSFQPLQIYKNNFLSSPLLDDSIATYFAQIEVDNFIGQNEGYVLLRKTAHESARKYSPIYYLFDKRTKKIDQITFPKGMKQDYEGAALLHKDVFFYRYDKRTYELILYKIPLADLILTSFDPRKHSFPEDK